MSARISSARVAMSFVAVLGAFLSAAPSGASGPTAVPAGAKAYVPVDEGTLAVVDLATMTTVKTLTIGAEPRGLDSTPDQAFVYVANSQGSVVVGELAVATVSVIDTATDAVTETIVLSTIGPYDCAVTPDGSRVYVACNSGVVSVIDTQTRTETGVIFLAPGSNPESLAVSPDGTKVYVAERGSGAIEVIDTATNQVVGPPIVVNSAPRDVAFSADGAKAIVVGDNAPQIIDVATATVTASVLDDIGSQRHVTVVGNVAYVTNLNFQPPIEEKGPGKTIAITGEGSIDVYGLATGTWDDSFHAGVLEPYGIDSLPSANCAFVTSKNDFRLGALDLATLDPVLGEADTGGTSRGVAVVVPIEIVDSFFLPKKVAHKKNAKKPAKSVFKASGFFDTGSKDVDLTAAATLSVGGFDIDVPSLATKNGRTFTYQAGGVKFVVVKNPFGSSRAKFRLTYTGDLGATVPTDGTVELRFANDAVDGNCEVLLQNGGFRLGKKRGALSKPNVFVVRSHAFVNGGGKDSLAIIVGLATGGVTPATAPEVRVQYGAVLSATIPAASFTRKGESFVFKGDVGGITNVVLDYLREQVTIVGKDLDLGTFPPGQSPLTIIVGVGTDDRGVAVRVARKGNLLKY